MSKEQLDDSAYRKSVIRDIILSYRKYGMTANEYFSYGFPKKNAYERNKYISRMRKDKLCMEAIGKNWKDALAQLKDKNIFYSIAGQFFKRKACKVDSEDDRSNFKLFCQGLDRFIAKPSKGACGKGVEIISLLEKSADEVFDYLRSNGSYIVEELVKQDARMAEWNESSVNTIRYFSFRKGSDFSTMVSVLRVGRKGSVVDNAGCGGVFAAIDSNTGIIITDGHDELGRVFKEHPESNKVFKGYKIPEWESLKKFAQEVHKSLPECHKYIGFDFALSTQGWVLIEGNWGDIIMPQISLGRGFYDEFKEAILK
ncbi:conserved domain protein [Fibrobacter succinogenes subsp. succinogenes S85]|uniref:Conserved domain protein n=1 Tax=Fibrobacter succinogenes (strain ATCC 19169 / S85) TaxID=59374 RepID=D9S901_FIBSS|nr:conserved domain protein [Fibrobacter succinogenes subsp. succinogenes S85]